jgi:hypothetical protein
MMPTIPLPDAPVTWSVGGAPHRWFIATLVALLVVSLPAAAATQASVQGSFTASSMEVGSVAAETGAYLLGMPVINGSSSSPPYVWSFEAEKVQVVRTVETWQRIGYLARNFEGSRVERTVHDEANGVMTGIANLAYLAAASSDPSNPATTLALQTGLPNAHLVPSVRIDYGASNAATEGYLPTEFYVREYQFQRDWSNLAYTLQSPWEPITMRGDFRVTVYDMDFRVEDADGTTEYQTGPSSRVIDIFNPLPPPPLVETYNDTRAELIFSNAVFTLYPEGYSTKLFLAQATLSVNGSARFNDVDGTIWLNGQETRLARSLVKLDGHDLQLLTRPAEGVPMRLGIELSGNVGQAVVDGRDINLEGTTIAPAPAATPNWVWLGTVLLLLSLLAITGWKAALGALVRCVPDVVVHRTKRALRQGRYRRVISLTGRVLAHHPSHSQAAATHATALLAQQTPGTAAWFLKPFLGSSADSGELSLLYCISLRRDGRLKEASQALSTAMRRFPFLAMDLAGTDLEDLYLPEASEEGAVYV